MRVTVGAIVGLLAASRTEDELLAEYPYLEKADIRAVRSYAAWRTEQREINYSHMKILIDINLSPS